MKRLIRHLSRSAPVVAMALVVGTAPSVASPVYDSGLTMTQRDEPGDLTWAQRLVIMQATLPFHDVDEAVAAGYAPTDECVDDPNLGGMGYHYVNPALIEDGIVDPTIPEALLYAPARDGEIRLVAVEYVANDDDGDANTAHDRHSLFGEPFDGPHDGHAPGQPVHYDLHAWVWKANPAGDVAQFNPRVHCPDPGGQGT